MNRQLKERKIRRAKRNRIKILGTAESPRIAVFRSNKYLYIQLIDDATGKTIISGTTKNLESSDKKTKTDKAHELGKIIAEQALKSGIKRAVLDRRSYRYHGRIRAFAEGARKAGIKI